MWPGVTWWVWSTVADQLRITEYVINTLQDKRTDVLIRSISHSYDHHGAGISGFSCLWLWLIPKYTKVLINHCTTHLPHCVQKVLRLQGQHRPFPKALPENNRIYSTIINMLRYVLLKKCVYRVRWYTLLSREALKNTSWWRHQIKTFPAFTGHCAGYSPVTGEFPAQRSITRGFDFFFDLRLHTRLSKQWLGWWFETPSRPLWRHCNVSPTSSRQSVLVPCLLMFYVLIFSWET